MERINWKRAIGAGLLTGLVMNIGEFAIEPLMGRQMEQFFDRLKLPMPPESAMLGVAASAFAVGVIAVWLYAAVVSTYGRGVRPALAVGGVVWTLSCLIPNIAMLAFGLYSTSLFWFASLWPLAETLVATAIGARVYDGGVARRPLGAPA